MDRFLLHFVHLEIQFGAVIALDMPLSQYIIISLTPEYKGRYYKEIPFDIVSNGLDYRTEADWDFMHSLITSLRAKLKSEGRPFV